MRAGLESLATLPWLVRLRWIALLGQLVALVLYHRALDTPLNWPVVAPIFGFIALSNVGLARWLRREPPPERTHVAIAGVLTVDTLLLTVLLAVSGGATNPFTIFYIVHIVLAAVVLETRVTVWITLLSALGFGALFVLPADEHGGHMHHGHDMAMMEAHTRGMWIAFAIAAGVIAYFVRKISQTLAAQREQLDFLHEREASRARLASLAALAAGAAHELGTPLGTIAVAVRELELALERGDPIDQPVSDARLIAAEVERCRSIIGGMAAQTDADDLQPIATTPAELFDALRARFDRERASRIITRALPGDAAPLRIPQRAVVRALASLVKNAFDASSNEGDTVELELDGTQSGRVSISVRDRGSGMDARTSARAGEPFFTTKDPGAGMGLGLFIARSFVESIGGRLELRPGQPLGTVAVLTLPTTPAELPA
jgi:two-component system sensor histidine kinase RegB